MVFRALFGSRSDQGRGAAWDIWDIMAQMRLNLSYITKCGKKSQARRGSVYPNMWREISQA